MIFSFRKYREFAIELTDERGNGDGKISHVGEEGENFGY
jgi:hypothetical protein